MAKILPNPDDDISVVGHGGTYKYRNIADAVVSIANKFYFRHDEARVVRLKDPSSGKMRFFRTTSALVVKSDDGSYIHRSAAVKTEDGVWLDPASRNVVKIGDSYHRKGHCKQIDGKWYLASDPAIFKCCQSGSYDLIDYREKLDEKIYGKDYFVSSRSTKIVVTCKGHIIKLADQYTMLSGKTGEVVVYSRWDSEARYEAQINILYDFQDKTNPQEDRLKFIHALKSEEKHFVDFEFAENLGVYKVHHTRVNYFREMVDTYILPRYLKESEAIRIRVNKNFSDLDETENTAKIFKHVPRPWPGKHTIRRAPSYGIPVVSKHFNKTAGLKYSYGVEIETADGLLSNLLIDANGVLCVGDRSIGSAEYVTSPLTGNEGLLRLEKLLLGLSKSTLVDDRCSIHIHVGGIKGLTMPNFGRDFLINSTRLGCYIEEELYKAMPPSRNPTLYHCHSIKRWEKINKTNYDTYMGAYVFGPKEYWLSPTDSCPSPLFDFAPYKLSDSYNSKTPIGQWQNGRYKWLNLINCFSSTTPHKTIEFRIFSPTTNFHKVYAYLMLSLAFVDVVDNKPSLIKKGVTLNDLFDYSFRKYPDICSWMKKFYQQRKDKFNRTNIYPEKGYKGVKLDFINN